MSVLSTHKNLGSIPRDEQVPISPGLQVLAGNTSVGQ